MILSNYRGNQKFFILFNAEAVNAEAVEEKETKSCNILGTRLCCCYQIKNLIETIIKILVSMVVLCMLVLGVDCGSRKGIPNWPMNVDFLFWTFAGSTPSNTAGFSIKLARPNYTGSR